MVENQEATSVENPAFVEETGVVALETAEISPPPKAISSFRKRCAYCVCAVGIVAIAALGTLFGAFYFENASFEVDSDSIELSVADFSFDGIDIEGTFNVSITNPNNAPIIIEEIDATLTFDSLVVDIDLSDVDRLPPNTVLEVPALLDAKVTFAQSGAVAVIAARCLGGGNIPFDLDLIVVGSYLGVGATLTFPTRTFNVGC